MSGFKFTITQTPAHLEIPDDARTQANELLLEQNVARMRQGLNSRGENLPPGVDLYQSGRLQSDTEADADGYRFLAPYAEDVDRRYEFAGVDERAAQEVEDKISEAWEDAGLTIEED